MNTGDINHPDLSCEVLRLHVVAINKDNAQ